MDFAFIGVNATNEYEVPSRSASGSLTGSNSSQIIQDPSKRSFLRRAFSGSSEKVSTKDGKAKPSVSENQSMDSYEEELWQQEQEKRKLRRANLKDRKKITAVKMSMANADLKGMDDNQKRSDISRNKVMTWGPGVQTPAVQRGVFECQKIMAEDFNLENYGDLTAQKRETIRHLAYVKKLQPSASKKQMNAAESALATVYFQFLWDSLITDKAEKKAQEFDCVSPLHRAFKQASFSPEWTHNGGATPTPVQQPSFFTMNEEEAIDLAKAKCCMTIPPAVETLRLAVPWQPRGEDIDIICAENEERQEEDVMMSSPFPHKIEISAAASESFWSRRNPNELDQELAALLMNTRAKDIRWIASCLHQEFEAHPERMLRMDSLDRLDIEMEMAQ